MLSPFLSNDVLPRTVSKLCVVSAAQARTPSRIAFWSAFALVLRNSSSDFRMTTAHASAGPL